MKLRSKRIALDRAGAGMRLAAPLYNHRGDVLMPAGYELSASVLDSLRKRGIARIAVWFEDSRSDNDLAAERSKVQARVNLLFRNAAHDAELALLYHLVLEYRSKDLS